MTRLAHDLHAVASARTRLDVLAPTSVHVGMTNVIGMTTIYIGDEIPGLRGQKVRIFGVMRAALLSNTNVDADDYFVTDDNALQRLGGVTKHDRVDTAHLRADGSASFVHCDPRAIDLECFAHLGNEAGEP